MKTSVLVVALLFLSCAAKCGQSARILGVFTAPSKSHYTVGRVLMEALGKKGHDVTVVGPFPDKNKFYKTVELAGLVEQVSAMMPHLDEWAEKPMGITASALMFSSFSVDLVNQTLNHPNMQKFLRSKEKFDVVVLEQFVTDAYRGICHHFDAPCVMISAIESHIFINELTGNAENPSYVSQMSLQHFGPMGFYKRLINVYAYVLNKLLHHLVTVPGQNRVMQETIPNVPHLSELLYKPTLYLLNSHSSISSVMPLLPSMIEIGGYHVQPPKKLPEDLQKYLDDAKEGVVYFSMGSVLKSKDMSEEKKKVILTVLSKLKMKVLWKFEEESLPGKPDNVKISKWLPQSDILAHPNVKLFISHGGMMGTTEAAVRGVPVLGMPFYGDQKSNIERYVHSGFAVAMDYKTLTVESFTAALNEALNNKKYAENAKRISKLMADRPIKPLDAAIFWVEYATRNRNLDHLKSLALDLCWFQYHLLDIYVFLLVCLVGGFLAVKYCLRKLCGALCKSKKVTTKAKKNN